MPLSRVLPAVAVLFALAATIPVMAQFKEQADVLELKKKVAALEKRVAALESKSGATAATPEQEAAAQTAYGEVTKLIREGKMEPAKTKMASFMKQYGTTNIAKRARRTSQELAVVGKAVPTKWGIEKWYQGEKEIDLKKSDTTLLVFWELWCPHCKREVPKLDELYKSLKDDGLQMVALTKITKSATEQGVLDFIKEKAVSYPMAKENGEISTHFGVRGIPAAAMIKGGKVIWRGHPGGLSEEMIKAWL